jgi:fatty acid amide hydrolase
MQDRISQLLFSKKKVILGVIGAYGLIKFSKLLKTIYIRRKLSNKAKKKLSERKTIELEVPLEKQEYILSLTASELAKSIQQKKVTSVEAVSTYIIRAVTLGRQYNFIADECYETALLQAKDCDEKLRNGVILGPLHGVPISIKDNIKLKGTVATTGVAWKLDQIDTETAVVAELLIEQGAVPFVKSNLTQMLLWMECSNKIFGTALNPWDPTRTTGGSSGGEAGLIACRGSPLGLGSDIGGSIRYPCGFCGVYGFKPTTQRASINGIDSAFENNITPLQFIIRSSPAGIAKCVDDLVLVMKIWLSDRMFKKDLELPPLIFNQSMYDSHQNRLKIGYFFDLPYFDSAPCIKNAIQECISHLEKNHEVVKFEIPNAKEIIELFTAASNANGNIDLKKGLKGELPENFYRFQLLIGDYPFIKDLAVKVLKLTGNKRLGEFIDVKGNISPEEYIKIFQRLQDLAEKLTEYWESLKIDAVICPVYGIIAPYHNQSVKVLPAICYSMIWNAVRYPTGVVPVRLVKTNETEYEDKYNDIVTTAAKKSMNNSEGMPISLQVVGLPNSDEKVLGVMKLVENIFDFHKHPF